MSFVTHSVTNQAPEFAPRNLWLSDRALQTHVTAQGGGWAAEKLSAYGELAGGVLMEAGRLANEPAHKPKLKLFNRFGERLDEVEFHPAYHQLMREAIAHGVPSLAWREPREGAHVARMGLGYLHNQPDQGTSCPLTMTYACVPALRHAPELARDWLPKVLSTEYDPTPGPLAAKRGVTIGMGMTEKQGGSDVRANTTRATAQMDGSYRLIGHKWFFSAPMCDAWLVLANTAAGVTCFLAPKILPDGSRNAIHIQRLKDKLGDWSNASSEVEFCNAFAWRVGPEGRGVATILEMVALTRLDCMIGSASIVRQAVAQALHHTAHRSAFGKLLVQQPLMQNVLADLSLESEAMVALTARVARAVDRSPQDEHEAALARIATAIGKYWVCKRAVPTVNEAQECLGGAGYVEESLLPRLYRQAPLNSIWEGSGNIQALDVLRAISREPVTAEALLAELRSARGLNSHYDRAMDGLVCELEDHDQLEVRARRITERAALLLSASCLLQHSPAEVAESYCASRLGGNMGLAFGALAANAAFQALIQRAMPS